MRGQDDRKRERHARDGVWRPAGEESPAGRGFPGSWHPAKPRDCKGAGHRPFTRPRQAAGWPIAPADRGGTAHAELPRGTSWASLALSANLPKPCGQAIAFGMVHKCPRRLAGRAEGRAESVRGQEDRKRERHARDGVSRPAGEDRPTARGFPGSRHPAKTRDCKGAGQRPFTRPRQAAGWQTAQADTGRNGPNPIDQAASISQS